MSRTQPGVELVQTFPQKFSALSLDFPKTARSLEQQAAEVKPQPLDPQQSTQSQSFQQSPGQGLQQSEAQTQTALSLVKRIPITSIVPQKRTATHLDEREVLIEQPTDFFKTYSTEKVSCVLSKLSKLEVSLNGKAVYLSGLGGVAVFKLASGEFKPASLDGKLACIQLKSSEHHSDQLLVQEANSNSLKLLNLSLDPTLEFTSQSPETDERTPGSLSQVRVQVFPTLARPGLHALEKRPRRDVDLRRAAEIRQRENPALLARRAAGFQTTRSSGQQRL